MLARLLCWTLIVLLAALAASCRRRQAAAVAAHAHTAATVVDKPDQAVQYAYVTSDQAAVNGVQPGYTEGQVRDLVGSADSVSRPESTEVGVFHTWYYPGLSVEFTGERVSEVLCLDAPCSTNAGIKVGSLRAAVERAYGPPTLPGFGAYGAREAGTYLIRGADCRIRFHYNSDHVELIKVFCDYS